MNVQVHENYLCVCILHGQRSNFDGFGQNRMELDGISLNISKRDKALFINDQPGFTSYGILSRKLPINHQKWPPFGLLF